MDTLTIRYFIALAQNLNFTKTAKQFYTSQQNISQHIKKLEQYYEVNLFTRKPKLKLTTEGLAIYEVLHKMTILEDNTFSIISDLKGSHVGQLKIGTTPYRGLFWIPKVLPLFLEKWPNIQIKIITDKTNNLEKQLLEGNLDMIVGLEIASNQYFQSINLIEDPLYFVVTPQLLKTYIDVSPMRIEELSQGVTLETVALFPYIRLTSNTKLRKQIDKLFEQAKITPKTVLETDNMELMISLIPNNIGTFFCTGLRVNDLKEKYPSVHFFPVSGKKKAVNSKFNLCYLKEKYRSKYFQDFIDIVQTFFKNI